MLNTLNDSVRYTEEVSYTSFPRTPSRRAGLLCNLMIC
jgi:hypothetical protein